jgi:hypothetical protein
MFSVTCAGAAAWTLSHLTRPVISDALAPVLDAAGGLVEVTLLVDLPFVAVIAGGILLRFGDLRPRNVGLVRGDIPLGFGGTAGTWTLVQVTGVVALLWNDGREDRGEFERV